MLNDERIGRLLQAIGEITSTAGEQETTKIIPNCEVIDSAPAGLTGYIIVKNELGFYIPAVKSPDIFYSNGDFVNILLIKGTEPIAFQHGSASGTGGYSGWPFINIIHVVNQGELEAAIASVGLNDIILLDNDIEVNAAIEITSGVTIAGFGVSDSHTVFRETGRVFTITDTFEDAVTFQNVTIRSDFLSEPEEVIYIQNSDVEFINSRIQASGGAENTAVIRILVDDTSDTDGRNLDLIYSEVSHDGAGGPGYAIYAENTVDPTVTSEIQIRGGKLQAPDTQLYLDDTSSILQLPVFLTTQEFSLVGGSSWVGQYMASSGEIRTGPTTDIYISGDEAGVKARATDIYETGIDDHFDGASFTGFTWASYSGFVTPSNIDLASFPSFVRFQNLTADGPTARAFAYQAMSGSTTIFARCFTGADCRAGVRIDDGDNNDYFEHFIEFQSGGLYKLRYRYAVGGVVTGPTDIWATAAPGQLVTLILQYNSGLNFATLHKLDSPNTVNTFSISTGTLTWTPSRVGLYHEHVAGAQAVSRASVFDWYRIT